jgi:hypothetical protein
MGDCQRPSVRVKGLSRSSALLSAFLTLPARPDFDSLRDPIPIFRIALFVHRHFILQIFQTGRGFVLQYF